MTETMTHPHTDDAPHRDAGAVEHTDSTIPTMSPMAVAYEIIRETISRHNASGASTYSASSHDGSAHSENAALARGVLEALTAQELLVGTEDIQRRYEMLD